MRSWLRPSCGRLGVDDAIGPQHLGDREASISSTKSMVPTTWLRSDGFATKGLGEVPSAPAHYRGISAERSQRSPPTRDRRRRSASRAARRTGRWWRVRACCTLVEPGIVEGDLESKKAGTQRPDAEMRSMRSVAAERGAPPRGRRRRRSTSAGQVVGVELGGVDPQASRSRGGVDRHQPPRRWGVRHHRATDLHGHAGRGLVVVRRTGRSTRRRRARVGADIGGRTSGLQMRSGLGARGELGGELAEGQVLALVLDQPEGRRVPKARGAAVAEDDFIAFGQGEQLAQAGAERRPRT